MSDEFENDFEGEELDEEKNLPKGMHIEDGEEDLLGDNPDEDPEIGDGDEFEDDSEEEDM